MLTPSEDRSSDVPRYGLRPTRARQLHDGGSHVSKPKRYKDTQRRAQARAEPSETSTPQEQVPVFPPEIFSHVLSYNHIHHGQPIILRPESALYRMYINRSSADDDSDDDSDDEPSYDPHSYDQAPAPKQSAPSVNLLQVSKLFRDEGYKLFYCENTFGFAECGQMHEVLRRLNFHKRSLIRHIALDSQWRLDLEVDDDVYPSLRNDWGLYAGIELNEFPDLRTILLRIRCTAATLELVWKFFPSISLKKADRVIEISPDKGLLHTPDMKSTMEEWVASSVAGVWRELGMGHHLEKANIAFLYRETEEWEDDAPSKPLLSLAKIENNSEGSSQ